MRDTPSIAHNGIASPKSPLVLGQTLKAIFTPIIEALHHSRRLQAARFLRQNRDLIDAAHHSILRELDCREEAERCWRDLGSGRRPT